MQGLYISVFTLAGIKEISFWLSNIHPIVQIQTHQIFGYFLS